MGNLTGPHSSSLSVELQTAKVGPEEKTLNEEEEIMRNWRHKERGARVLDHRRSGDGEKITAKIAVSNVVENAPR